MYEITKKKYIIDTYEFIHHKITGYIEFVLNYLFLSLGVCFAAENDLPAGEGSVETVEVDIGSSRDGSRTGTINISNH